MILRKSTRSFACLNPPVQSFLTIMNFYETRQPFILSAALASILLVCASPAFGQCPVTADPATDIKATTQPVAWRVGEPIKIIIPGAFETVTAACFDGQESLPAARAADPATTSVTVTIPKT